MKPEEVAELADKLAEDVQAGGLAEGFYPEMAEFLRLYSGERSQFYDRVKYIETNYGQDWHTQKTLEVLKSYSRFLKAGLSGTISVERQAQLDVVSDYLEQAKTLLADRKVHPAAPAVLIGASLEEFLRNWVEGQGVALTGNPSIDTYAKALRSEDLISKQDKKDIDSWAGIRNHAAHGEWEEVEEKKRIEIMLEGVNLFMRKYS